MMNHPENDGRALITAFSKDVLSDAERIIRHAQYVHLLRQIGKGALEYCSVYGDAVWTCHATQYF